MTNPYDYIDDYINGQLSEEERIAFEALLSNDSDLRLAVDNHVVAMDIVGSLIEDEVRGVLAETESPLNVTTEETQKNESKIIGINWKKLIAAASVIAIIFVTGNLLLENRQEKIYATRYQEVIQQYDNEKYLSTRGSGEHGDNLKLAISSFNKNKWEEANNYFNLIESKENIDPNLLAYYKGHTYFHLHKFQESLIEIKKITKESIWYKRSENIKMLLDKILMD